MLEPGAVEAVYPEIDTYGSLAPVGAADFLGTGLDAVVTVSGYGVTRTNGKNGNNTVSYRERLMGQSFIINTRNPDTAGYNLQLPPTPAVAASAPASVTPAVPCSPATPPPCSP